MDWEAMSQKLARGSSGEALKKLAQSGDAEAMARAVDVSALEQAARAGDTQALGEALRRLLATPEGARFAAQVRKAAGGNGR